MVNSVRVKQKQPVRGGKGRWILAVIGVLFVASICIATAAAEWTYGTFGIIWPTHTVEVTAGGKIIKVPPGGNIQSALNLADSGDIIELQAGAVYPGTVSLPNKPLTDYVTIRSSAYKDLPENKRVSPSQRSSMATIAAGILSRPAVSATNGAHHYRFIGIEFAATTATYNYGLMLLGNGEAADRLPHHIEIDRCYFRPFKTGVVRRGIALNSADTVVKNSYIEGFGFASEETQGIAGWTGTRNVKILNNYIEGGAENILFGGADPTSADLIPMDIEVRRNHLNKPEAWSSGINVKTLFELKNSKRVQFVENYLTNNWMGEAFRITVRNQDGAAPFSTIEETLIKDNVIDGAGAGISILGKDDTHPSRLVTQLTITNNLFLNIGAGGKFTGKGYFIQISDGERISISRNTAFNRGLIASFHGTMPRELTVTDNIFNHGEYGVHGLPDVRSAAASRMFSGNIVMNLNNMTPGDISLPSGNIMAGSMEAIGFADTANEDFRLSERSRFKGKGSEISKIN